MYHDLKEIYWWNNMKKDVGDFVAKCPNCQQVKAEHQRPIGLAQSIEIPIWKWEMINMDFVSGYMALQSQSLQIKWLSSQPTFGRSFSKVWVVGDLSSIVPVETIEVNKELSYEEVPVAILDRQVRKLRNKEIASVKVLWQNQQVEKATWEAEDEIKKKYPHLFE
ncbi:uncharacterized protein [Nicotiana sylvestris]|uniref:uncharacterized protein n=1 Tax=Nicotiana sylvestris TaxID=4096 RepID=UPI00388CAED3